MPIEHVHSFLVHPSKNEDEPPSLKGVEVPLRGKLYDMLVTLFGTAHEECDIEIIFRPQDDGTQANECRDLLVAYMRNPSLAAGNPIAERLQRITTRRSGLGLLFLIKGTDGHGARLVTARFPADSGVVAEDRGKSLAIEFIERVFMKSAKAYKSVMYRAANSRAGFWDGWAVDKQINSERELSNYWISDFLDSELRTTGAAGTKRFAMALRGAIATADGPVRDELLLAAQLIRGQHGRVLRPDRLATAIGLSDSAMQRIQDAMPRADLFGESFKFDRDEYDRHVTYRSLRLNNGAVLTAENAHFGEVFKRETTGRAGEVRISTVGKVVEEKLRKST